MIEFDLHISPSFRGGQYFTSFSAMSVDDFLASLKHYWYKTGFTNSTGEIFVFAKVEANGEAIKLPCGYYVFYDDGELFALSSEPSSDAVLEAWSDFGLVFKAFQNEEDLFKDQIDCLFAQDAAHNN